MIYICSPYRANTEEQLQKHIEYARELTRAELLAGRCPVAVHLYMTQCLDEDKPEERSIGLAAGIGASHHCHKMVVGKRFGISEGMSGEIRTAEELGIEIEYRD